MKQYVVIAGAVPSVHDRKKVKKGDVLPENFFRDGEIGELVKGKFIAETHEISEAPAVAEIAAPAAQPAKPSGKKGNAVDPEA